MERIIKTDAEMLRELDTMCAADGMSSHHFVQVGHLAKVAGPDFDMARLNDTMCEQIRRLYAQYKGKK